MDPERRQVTVLFSDMVGFTAFSERSGEEAAFTLMRTLSKLMDEAVHEQRGVVQDFTGDGIMAVFGAPIAFEDAPLRACRAALSILHRVKAAGADLEVKHGVRPQLRIGLNTGVAVVGLVQGGADAGVRVLGDTVNFAKRLQTLAEPDLVFMSQAMYPRWKDGRGVLRRRAFRQGQVRTAKDLSARCHSPWSDTLRRGDADVDLTDTGWNSLSVDEKHHSIWSVHIARVRPVCASPSDA